MGTATDFYDMRRFTNHEITESFIIIIHPITNRRLRKLAQKWLIDGMPAGCTQSLSKTYYLFQMTVVPVNH